MVMELTRQTTPHVTHKWTLVRGRICHLDVNFRVQSLVDRQLVVRFSTHNPELVGDRYEGVEFGSA